MYVIVVVLLNFLFTNSVYWEPEIPVPGGDITIYYNTIEGSLPNNTFPVYVHLGYDGWNDVDDYAMSYYPVNGAGWWKYTYQIPEDAETVDFVFTDLNDNGSYDFGEPIFGGGGEEIYYETNYGDAIADGPAPADLGTDELQSLSLPADVYILNLHIEDPYGDSDFVSYVIGVSAERNDGPSSDAGLDQEWYMNYEEDYKEIEMFAHSVDDSDHDPLVYGWSYEGPGTDTDSQAQASDETADDADIDGFFWEVFGYSSVENNQGLVEGEHTFTLTSTDPYGATASSSFVIAVYDEPAAVAVTDLRVTNEDQAFKHIEVAWEEGVHDADEFLVDGTYIWTGDHANADYFILYLNGVARATYTNDEETVGEFLELKEFASGDAAWSDELQIEKFALRSHLDVGVLDETGVALQD